MHYLKRLLWLFAFLGICFSLALVYDRVGNSTPKSDDTASTMTGEVIVKTVDSCVIVKHPYQEEEFEVPLPECASLGPVEFKLIDRSCSCVSWKHSIVAEGVPCLKLMLRLNGDRQHKDAAARFQVRAAGRSFQVRVTIRVDAYPEFWIEPESVRVMTLKPEEKDRVFTVVAATASNDLKDRRGLALLPLPESLTLLDETSTCEVIDSVLVCRSTASLKYSVPEMSDKVEQTTIRWSARDRVHEQRFFWKTSASVSCSPSPLLATCFGARTEQWAGDVLVTSGGEPIRVVSASCSSSQVDYLVAPGFERRKRISLSLRNVESRAGPLNDIIKTEDTKGDVHEVSLPVVVVRAEKS